jgi:crotonobetainyl-CoA:carnitine CoA-transferase CaiB-like acyl-CoA transferase
LISTRRAGFAKELKNEDRVSLRAFDERVGCTLDSDLAERNLCRKSSLIPGFVAMNSVEPGSGKRESLPLDRLPRIAVAQGFRFLDGVKVIDLSSSIAGPFAAMVLGDLGAEVIKVEKPGAGDDSRSWGPPFLSEESLWFLSVNRNKQSIGLDFSRPEGLAVLRDLLGRADVVISNQTPRVAKKLGIDPDCVRALNPSIIYLSVTGFGLTGERSDWPCYDLIAEGYSGVMDVTGEIESAPQKIGAPAADMLAGQDAALAAVAALFERTRTGQGRVVDVALVDSMTRFLSCRIVPFLGSGEIPVRSGGRDSVIAIYQAFETSDRPITLALGNDAIWRRFWSAVGKPEYAERPGLESNAKRRERRSEIVAEIESILRTQSRSIWLDIFTKARVPAGPINRVDEVASDSYLHARGLLYSLTSGDRAIPQVGTAFLVDGEHNVPRFPPPQIGAQTRDILTGLLGYNETRLQALESAKII